MSLTASCSDTAGTRFLRLPERPCQWCTCLGMGDEISTDQRSDIVHIIGRPFLGLLNLLTGISAIEEIFERCPWSQRCRSAVLKR